MAGARLGTTLQKDRAWAIISTHSRVAIRQQLDILLRLNKIMELIQSHKLRLNGSPVDKRILVDRMEGLLDRVDSEVNTVHMMTTTAVHNWGDLDKKAVDDSVKEYESRGEKMKGQLSQHERRTVRTHSAHRQQSGSAD
ncbi:hypothetical protein GCM10009834_45100 [Streptomonospora arabica]